MCGCGPWVLRANSFASHVRRNTPPKVVLDDNADPHASELTYRNRLFARRKGVYFSNYFSS